MPVMVVGPLDESVPEDAGAGDPDGMDMNNSGRGRPKWWLKVHRSEIDRLMLIEGPLNVNPAVPDESAVAEVPTDTAPIRDKRQQRHPGEFSIWDDFEKDE